MNILIATNNEYVRFAMVMLYSLFKHNNCDMDIYLPYNDLSEESLKKLSVFIENYPGKKLIPLKLSADFDKKVESHNGISIETYYRILVINLLPKEIERILYLDVDMVVQGSLRELYDTDISGHPFVVCEDILGILNDFHEANKFRMNIPENYSYFNAGVMLFNLNYLRETDEANKIIEKIYSDYERYEYNDQDVLNELYYDKLKWAPWDKYNCPPAIYWLDQEALKKGKVSFASYSELRVVSSQPELLKKKYINVTEQMKSSATIIHYMGAAKPWRSDRNSSTYQSFNDVYFKYEKELLELTGEKKKTRMFVCTHKPTVLPSDDSVFVPLQVGAATNGRIGILSDDTGDNISAKNCFYGELTGLYWLWKNYTDVDIIGICHYRRFFFKEDGQLMLALDFEKALEDCDMLLSNAMESEVTYYEGFTAAHRPIFLEQTGEVIKKICPEYYPAFEENLQSHTVYVGNLAVMRKKVFDEYCSWLFSIFFEMEKIVDLSGLDDYHRRLYGFISEGMMPVFAKTKGLKIKAGNIGFTEEKKETKELKLALTQLVREGKFSEARELYYGIMKIRPDVRLQHSDIFDELGCMEIILYILEEEKKQNIDGLYAVSHEIGELVKYIKKLGPLIKKDSKGETLLPEELTLMEASPLSDLAREIIKIN